MVPKIYQQKIEGEAKFIGLDVYQLRENLIQSEIDADEKFLAEIEKFASRNTIFADSNGKKEKHICCGLCLRAHSVKVARELGLGKKTINDIRNLFTCDEGHYGYYLDSGEVKKV
jgi:hypothetical protein